MSILSTIEADIPSAVKAIDYLRQVNWHGLYEHFTKPAPTINDPGHSHSIVSDLKQIEPDAEAADGVIKAIGVFVPPVAVAANDLEAAIDVVKFVSGVSTFQATIPQVTLDTENAIADRFQTTFKVSN